MRQVNRQSWPKCNYNFPLKFCKRYLALQKRRWIHPPIQWIYCLRYLPSRDHLRRQDKVQFLADILHTSLFFHSQKDQKILRDYIALNGMAKRINTTIRRETTFCFITAQGLVILLEFWRMVFLSNHLSPTTRVRIMETEYTLLMLSLNLLATVKIWCLSAELRSEIKKKLEAQILTFIIIWVCRLGFTFFNIAWRRLRIGKSCWTEIPAK